MRRDIAAKRARLNLQNPCSSDVAAFGWTQEYVTRQLQDSGNWLRCKSWDGYYGDNPFKPVGYGVGIRS